MDEPFNAGPRLGDALAGDVAAQAVASLRGYSYQLFASALAWVNLRPDEVLHLEVAQDYAVVGDQALSAVEVKDRPTSTLTLNSDAVRAALESFVKLVTLNPQLHVQLHFLSTGEIGREKAKAHRIKNAPALAYWRRAAAGADVGPLRHVLSALKLSPTVHKFIDVRSDELLREEFLRRIHWDCGAPPLDELAQTLEASLERFVIERFDARAYEKGRLTTAVIFKVLMTCVRGKDRYLDSTMLRSVLTDATKVSIQRWQLDAMLNALSSQADIADSGRAISVDRDSSVLERNDSIPFPALLAPRSALINDIVRRVGQMGVGFLSGSSGCGKTLVARLVGLSSGGGWGIIDCRDLSVEETVARMHRALGLVGSSGLRGVILEDINVLEEPRVRLALSVFVSAARRADVQCLVTAYLRPSTRVLSELGADATAHFGIGYFTEKEIEDLLLAAGGDPLVWVRAVFRGSAFGHPQLVQALMMGLRARSWPIAERDPLSNFHLSEEVEAEKSTARRQLIAAVPEPARLLLYRTSLIIGRFGRSRAMVLGGLAPNVTNPGEQLDLLVGPWIEQLGAAQLRVSPLVQWAGREVFELDEQRRIHRAIAEDLVRERSINVTDANAVFLHALMGRAEQVLLGLAHSVLVAQFEQRRQLAEWLVGLRLHRLDQLIDAPTPALPLMLRLAQFLLVSSGKDGKAIRACWAVLVSEVGGTLSTEQRDGFEFMMLAKALIDEGAAGQLPGWIGLILRFEALAQESPQRKWVLATQQPTGTKRVSTVVGVLFLVQLWHVDSVAGLLAAFEQLNHLSIAQRSTLFADLVANPSDFRYVTQNAWVAERKRATLQWQQCAEAYLRMATLSLEWGFRTLAVQCHVARAIMLDEYAKDSLAAERALQEAAILLGEDAALSRARARVLYRRKDYASALELMRAAKSEAGQQTIANPDPIERAYMFREAGISAGELGDWADARNWFAAARVAAARAHAPAMRVMTIGLHADEALAAAKSGDLEFAVSTMHEVTGELSSLDASSSIVAGYCHRVVRHGILWLFGVCTHHLVEVENQPARIVPGMCSNPEPTDMSAMPLGSIDYAVYLLAQSAVEAAVHREVETRIVASLAGRVIPGMEMALRNSRLARAIEARDALEAVHLLPAWVDARVFMQSHPEIMRGMDMITPIYIEIPAITESDRVSDTAAAVVNDVVLAFGAMCAMSADQDAIVQLREGVYEFSENVEVRHKLDVMVGAASERASESQRMSFAAHNAELTPNELFLVSLSLVRVAARSDFKRVLSWSIAAWSRRKWRYAISHQTFLMSNPRVNVPAIQMELREAMEDLGFVGRLLLSAEPAVSTQLDKGYRDFLAALAGAHG